MPTVPSQPAEHEHRPSFGGQALDGERLKNCDRPKVMVCSECGDRLYLVRCGTANERACSPCANTYRRRVSVVGQSGFFIARKGDMLFMTFTAPGNRAHGRRGFVCPCTPAGGVDLGKWNGEAVHRWNRLQQAIERKWGVEFSYFKASEVQERGALHFHVLARMSKQVVIRESALRALAIRHGFGHSIDLQVKSGDGRSVGRYLAKYVSKAATERRSVPYVHRKTGERGPGRWRTWTASRDWGLTMAQVKADQVAWMLEQRAGAEPEGRSPEAGALDHKTMGYAPAVPTLVEKQPV